MKVRRDVNSYRIPVLWFKTGDSVLTLTTQPECLPSDEFSRRAILSPNRKEERQWTLHLQNRLQDNR